jgi:hypothetical protein
LATLKFDKRIALLAIAITALLARFFAVSRGGGFKSVFGYDDGVYMGAGTGLAHGLIPYRDFLFVHPPGILLIISPFGYLGNFITDANAFVMARLFFILVGVATTIIVTRIGFRIGNWAGVFAGFTYALWLPVVREERTTLLEVFCVFFFALALFFIGKTDLTRKDIVLGGIFLGLATSVKLWMAVPVIVISLWLFARRKIKSGLIFGFSSFSVFALICAPFLLLSNGKMWDLVWKAQISRAGKPESRLPRLAQIFNITKRLAPVVENPVFIIIVSGLVIFALILIFNKYKISRLYLALIVAQLTVLMSSPIFFHGYSSYVTVPIILLVSLFFQRLIDFKYTAHLLVPIFIVSLAFNLSAVSELLPQQKYPAKAISKMVAHAKCVTSDSPSVLLLSNTLTRTIKNGCQVKFDVDGEIYGVNGGVNNEKLTSMERRRNSLQYQNELMKYFESGDVTILKREVADALTPATMRKLESLDLDVSTGLYRIYEK